MTDIFYQKELAIVNTYVSVHKEKIVTNLRKWPKQNDIEACVFQN